MIQRVTVRRLVNTICPNGTTIDINEVRVSWRWRGQHIDAEAIHAVVDDFAGRTIYAEDLAEAIVTQVSRKIGGGPISVEVEQVAGHGVTVLATCL